ncbi:RUS family member 1 isoform X7 [Buteo buteo]|uniref:RUS family member 1 isoform X7 n=1 Tax=Buteo buteo TaxID=30397 RepID=UPI003EC0D43F
MKRPEGPGGGLGPPQDPPPPLCRELWGSREAARYREDSRGGLQRLVPPGACSHSCLRRAAARVLLPQGYPESVSPDYLQYQCWDALQHPDGRLGHPGGSPGRGGGRQRRHRHRGHPHLGAAGFPPKPAPVPKIARFHPKTGAPADGVGMVTRITFAWLQGTRLDCEAKQWRLAADVLNDAALVLELLAPAWPRAGPALLALAAAAKCIVGVAGGATRAALAVHQARRDNVADVAAKDGSQVPPCTGWSTAKPNSGRRWNAAPRITSSCCAPPEAGWGWACAGGPPPTPPCAPAPRRCCWRSCWDPTCPRGRPGGPPCARCSNACDAARRGRCRGASWPRAPACGARWAPPSCADWRPPVGRRGGTSWPPTNGSSTGRGPRAGPLGTSPALPPITGSALPRIDPNPPQNGAKKPAFFDDGSKNHQFGGRF